MKRLSDSKPEVNEHGHPKIMFLVEAIGAIRENKLSSLHFWFHAKALKQCVVYLDQQTGAL